MSRFEPLISPLELHVKQAQLGYDGHSRGDSVYSLVPCPKCGYVRKRLPLWVDFGVTFEGRGGVVYKVESIGATNGDTPNRAHFRDHVTVSVVKHPTVSFGVEDFADMWWARPL